MLRFINRIKIHKIFSFGFQWRIFFYVSVLFIFYDFYNAGAQVTNYKPDELQRIDVEEHLGEQVPLDLIFENDTGQRVPLKSYFSDGKPVILVLAYYRCPMLCSMVLNGLTDAAKQIPLKTGDDYKILTISIDPTETAELALQKKANYVNSWGDTTVADNWTYFVGDEKQIQKLSKALGFKYYYVKESKQYAHPAVLHILTEDGKISRYLYGIQFKPNDLRLALLEAGQGKIGNTIEKLLLYCYHYDPNSKGYAIFAGNVMKIGGLVTMVLMSIFLILLWVKYQKNHT